MEKNYQLEKGTFASADGRSQVAYYCFVPKAEKPRAIVQISHGMSEYVMRYEPLADYLAAQGYAVCGNDHVGHGSSVSSVEDLGFTSGADTFLDDVHSLWTLMDEKYPDTKHVLLGHSMGSFIARLYVTKYPEDADALVIVGTAGPGNPTALGKMVTKVIGAFCGARHRSKFVSQLAFGGYNKRIDNATSHVAWLSRDASVVEAYEKDEYCGFLFTAKGYYDLFDLIGRISHKSWAGRVSKTLPIYMISGDGDPVGNYGRGVEQVYGRLRAAGVEDVTLKLYPDMRHEIFNEIGREEVFRDLFCWLAEHDF